MAHKLFMTTPIYGVQGSYCPVDVRSQTHGAAAQLWNLDGEAPCNTPARTVQGQKLGLISI